MFLAITPGLAAAQQLGTVQGTVVDATTMQPLPGAQVSVVGTGRGILTNPQGRFNIVNVPSGGQTVRVNLIGYGQAEQSVAVPAGGSVTVEFAIRQSALTLEGVVVTALGIEREARTLGVAAQSLRPEQLPRVEANIVNAFTGRVAGVNVTATGPQGGSSRIVIRGENSITGNNQPLFIVDGIPIDNYGPGVLHHGSGGFDYGNLAQDLNPELIESITVLKGPNAAALYGSRASNGVILITTRKGAGGRAAEVMVSQTSSYESPLRLPRYQNQFGQGNGGLFSFWDGFGGGVNDGTDESWGPPLDVGLMIPQWNSPVTDMANRQRQPLPWVSNPNNVRDFFEPGLTNNTTVSIASAGERMSGRFSASRFGQDAMMPGQRLDRITLAFGGTMEATERLDLNTSIQFIQQEAVNRTGIAYGGDNPMGQMIWGARQLDFRQLREVYNVPRGPNEPANIQGLHTNWNYQYFNNPYFLQFDNPNEDERNRMIGQVQAGYQVNDWLRATARTGTDWYRDSRMKMYAERTIGGLYTTNPLTAAREFVGPNGAFADWGTDFQETNSDVIFIANPQLNLPFTFSATFGGSRRDAERRINYAWVQNLATPGVYDVSNAAETPDLWTETTRRRMNSVLGQADFGFNDYLFFTLTGRNDWSSTLPEQNRSYFYPSVSTSFIFTDAIPFFETSPLTYGKLRASWAQVGNDTDPYQLRNIYSAGRVYGSFPTFTIPGRLRNANLRPEITRSVEFGIEMGALNDRLGLDLTYYDANTSDQIMPVELSRTTGYSSQMVNAGTVQNRGIEALVRLTPVLTPAVRWETSFSFARNRNKVIELAEGVQGLQLSLGAFWGVENWARVGEPLGQLVSQRVLQRAPDGQVVIHPTGGYPMWSSVPEVIGNFNPDWRGGWANEISYRGVRASALLDVRQGGQLYSVTQSFGRFAGVLDETAVGRCTPANSPLASNPPPGYPLCNAETGLVLPGVNRRVVGNDTTYVQNQAVIDAQNRWFYAYFSPEESLVDASFVKLREVTIGFDVPAAVTSRLRVGAMNMALVGRNLGLWTENPHIDPETAFDASNIQGFEYGQTPAPRSLGLTITVRP